MNLDHAVFALAATAAAICLVSLWVAINLSGWRDL
jgi:hypothetical protein